MPTLDWWTGASYISLRVIVVTWWITSVTLIHHRSTAYESFTTGSRCVTLPRLVPCYKRDWATLLLLLLCCCCYYCSLLLCCYLLQDFVGANIPSTRLFLAPLPGIAKAFSGLLIQLLGIVCLVTKSFLAPLLSYYFATDTLLAYTNLSGAVESDTFSC